MKRKNYLLLFALLCLCTMTSWAQQLTEPERTVVYDMNYEGSKFYRIPSLVTAANGDLLAIADRRGDQLGDLPNDISVVCRRSTDKGKTWSKPITIAQGMGQGKGYGDPLTIPYTTKDGEHGLVCIFAGGNGLWKSTPSNKITFNMSRSTDNGVTWTKPVDFSETIYSATRCYGAFAGSGHGLQLKDGRLMFVIAASLSYQPDGGALYNYAVYSDDYGKTWQVSKNHVAQRGDEAKVVELENGNILMSIRSKGYRLFSVSTDRGETWGDAVPNYDLPDPACNGDIIRYPAKDGDNSFLIQSLPASSTMRTNVTVYASFDEGQTWKTKKLITDGYSAYSSLTVLQDGTIGMIVENGKWDSSIQDVKDGFVLEFVRFTKEWLLGEEENGGEELPKGVLACNGVDRYMTIPNSPDFFPTAGGEYTVTCRVKVPKYISGSNMRFLCARGYTGTDNNQISGYDFFGANSYQESFSVNLSLVGKPWSAGHAFAAGAINEGEWAHLAWTFNGATKQSYIYVDGMKVGEKSIPEYATNAWANELPILVGAGYLNEKNTACVPSFFANAEIDDVRFFNRTLSQAEVTADKTAKVTATTEGLVAAYDFENIQGTTVPDISGKGHDGTLVNFPSQSVKHKVTITKPDSKEGTLRVLNGTKEVPNGFMVAEGTTLTVEAVATDKYKVAAILVDGTAIEGNTFKLQKDVTVSVTFEKKDPNALEYEIPSPEKNDRTNGDHPNSRLIQTITVQGATFNGEPVEFAYTIDETNGKKYVYQDATAENLNVTQGNKLNMSWNFRSDDTEWMHYYLYIDYNKNGVFDVEQGELVSYSYIDNKNSLGESASIQAVCKNLPEFQIPVDALTQTTRMRFKCDWDSTDPVGNPQSDNRIGKNGGTIVDFTITINEAPKFAVTIEETEGGKIIVKDEKENVITNGQEVQLGTELTVTTEANKDYQLKRILVNDEELDGNSFVVRAATKVSAEFTNQVSVNYSITEGSTMTVTAGTTSVKSGDWINKGNDLAVEFTIPEGSYLTSVLVNETEKISELVDNKSLLIKNCQENTSIVATVQKRMHVITFGETENGSIRVENTSTGTKVSSGESVAENDEISIAVEPYDRYFIETFTINGNDKKAELNTSNTMTLKVTEALTLAATFKELTYKISWEVKGEGTVACVDYDSKSAINSGDQLTASQYPLFTITPNKEKGAKVESITQNNENVALENNDYLDKADPDNWSFIVEMTQDTELVFTFSTNTGIAKASEIFLGYNACTETLLIPENATAEIYDLTGKEVMYMSETTASTSNLNNGCYLVKIEMGNTTKTFKFVK